MGKIIFNDILITKYYILPNPRYIKKLTGVFDQQTLRILYFSLIYPYLPYCNIIWGNGYRTRLNKILLHNLRSPNANPHPTVISSNWYTKNRGHVHIPGEASKVAPQQ